MTAPVVDPHLSKQAQRFAPRAVVRIQEGVTNVGSRPWRLYILEQPGQPEQALGATYGTALAALRVLQQAAR